MNLLVLTLSLFTLFSPVDDLSIEFSTSEERGAAQSSRMVLVGTSDYEYIPWGMLLSEEEADFHMDEYAKYLMDPTYTGGEAPPAGVNMDVNGMKVSIAGFAVGLDAIPGEYNRVSSFLFVPTEGSCIHIPPPPPNQTIFVEMRRAVRTDPYKPIVLEGTIYVEEGESEIGSYFYRFEGDSIRDYDR